MLAPNADGNMRAHPAPQPRGNRMNKWDRVESACPSLLVDAERREVSR